MKERLITEEERKELYNNGKGLDYPFITIKEKLLKEIEKYPKKQNYESGLSGYCLKVINSTDKLNRFEKKSFSEILSRWVLEERLEQHEETSKAKNEEFIKILNKFEEELLIIVDNCVNSCYILKVNIMRNLKN